MTLPNWFKPAIWGAIVGAVALIVVGSGTGWVVTNSSAERTAKSRSEKAVLAAMTPICVAQFKSVNREKHAAMLRDRADAADPQGPVLAALKKEDSWKRAAFVSKKGWATMPGSAKPNADVASACADELMKLTK